jgi:hypothetical protein
MRKIADIDSECASLARARFRRVRQTTWLAASIAMLALHPAGALPIAKMPTVAPGRAAPVLRAAQGVPNTVVLDGTIARVDVAGAHLALTGLSGAESFWAQDAATLAVDPSVDLRHVRVGGYARVLLRRVKAVGFVVTKIDEDSSARPGLP